LEWDQPMVKRRKEEDIAGVLEFAGRAGDDAEFMAWLADHKARNGGKIRVGQGAKGIRVMFTKEADMALWKARSEKAAKDKNRLRLTATDPQFPPKLGLSLSKAR
jgi:hypothetical protein